jgi:hypothetical protein
MAGACLLTAVSLLLLEVLFMQIPGVSLTLPWPLRLCLLSILLCTNHCYKLSPFQPHWGRWLCTCFFGLCVCLQLTWEVGLPPSLVEFSFHHYFYKLSCSWLLGVHPRSCRSLPGQTWLVYLQSWEGFPSPPLRCSVHPTLFAYYSVSLFSLGGGRYLQGAMLIWPRVVCGSAMYHLAHLMVHVCVQVTGGPGPSWFLHLTWRGDSLRRLEVWRGQSFASSQWFCLQGVSPVSLQGFTIGGTLSASSL